MAQKSIWKKIGKDEYVIRDDFKQDDKLIKELDDRHLNYARCG